MIRQAAVSPNDIAERLTGRRYLSWSQVSLYRSCPLRFAFHYVEGIPEETVSSSLVFGSGIHAAIQFHHEELLAGNPPPTIGSLMDAYRSVWIGFEDREVRFGKDEDEASLTDLAVKLLETFRASDVATPKGNVIGIEEEIVTPLIPGVPDLLARLDLVVDEPDSLVITDFKTSRTRWSAEQAEHSADQLLLYAESARQLMPDKQVRLQFVVLTKTKTPTIEVHKVALSRPKTNRNLRVLERIWHSIEQQNFYPAPSPMQCPTCPYRRQCGSWAGDP